MLPSVFVRSRSQRLRPGGDGERGRYSSLDILTNEYFHSKVVGRLASFQVRGLKCRETERPHGGGRHLLNFNPEVRAAAATIHNRLVAALRNARPAPEKAQKPRRGRPRRALG